MNIGSLAIDQLLSSALKNIDQNKTYTKLPSSSFASLLSEALLQMQLSNMDNDQQDSSSTLLNSLNSFTSSLGFDPSILGGDSSNLENVLSSIGNGTASVKASSPNSTDIAATELNDQLKGALQNAGDSFVEAGKKYQISPALLAAISMHETGNGTSNAAKYKYNVAGMMGKSGLKTYSSIEESIFDMARNLRNNYLDKGKTTIAQIGAKYAPIGAANDPTQLNNHWINGVQQYFDNMTKKTDFA